jgi:4-hydroxybenzoyl-CoA thioesterase
MPFPTRIKVRFGDVDPAGLVYYPVIFHYAHIAMEEFFEDKFGISYSELMSRHRIGFPTVNTQSDFFTPLVYGDEVDVKVEVLKIGRTSLTLRYSMIRVSDGTLCSNVTNVHVAMDLEARRPIEITQDQRTALDLL